MNVLNNILNKELKTSSFIMRSLSLVLLVFSTIAGILSLLFSKTFINAVFSLVNMMTTAFYTLLMASVDVIKYAHKILIEYNIHYVFQNKLLLSLACITILSVVISYRFITFYKKGYKPYYFNYYNISMFIEVSLAIVLLNILLSSFIKSFSVSYSPLYDNLIRATFITYFVAYPIIVFLIFNIKSSLFISKYKDIFLYFKDDLNESIGTLFPPFLMALITGIIYLLVNHSTPFGYFLILNSFVIYFVIVLCSCSSDFQKHALSESESMMEISDLKSLLYFNNNDTDFVEKTFNIKDEKDFYLMYVQITVLNGGVEKSVKYQKYMKDYMGHNFKYKYYDLNFNLIATVN